MTTIVDMPLNSIPPTVDVAALDAKQAAAEGQLAVDVAFWGGAIPGNADDLAALHERGVVGFKCFLLPSGVEEFPPLDADGLGLAMRAIAEFDGLLIAHAEDEHVIDAAPAAHGRHYADFVASRPPEAEVRAIETLLEQTRRTGCRTHVVHLSGAATLPLIRAAKDEGLPVTAETCPHYLALRAEDVPDGGTQFKCCPPIRDDANRDALWAGLADSTIDCIVSDHSPCTIAAKRLDTGDFGEAWGGIASVQLGLPSSGTRRAGAVSRSGASCTGWRPRRPPSPGSPDAAPSRRVTGPTCASSRRTRRSWSTRRSCGTAIRSARTRSPPVRGRAADVVGWSRDQGRRATGSAGVTMTVVAPPRDLRTSRLLLGAPSWTSGGCPTSPRARSAAPSCSPTTISTATRTG